MKLKYTEQDFEFFKFYKKEIMPILENFEDSRYKTANSCLKIKKNTYNHFYYYACNFFNNTYSLYF